MDKNTQLINEFTDYLEESLHTSIEEASPQQIYKAAARIVNSKLQERYKEFWKKKNRIEKETHGKKKIYYISMEFLMGQSLKNALYCLGVMDEVRAFFKSKGFELEDILECEPDAGLGNGGLGRLAACYLSAMATGSYDATGFSLRYEYGLFKQKIEDGWQVELPDNWIPGGGVWLNKRDDDPFFVTFYGRYNEWWDETGFHFSLDEPQVVEAIPYDMYVPGAGNDAVEKLRLWRAIDPEGFDMESFNSGDFTRAAQKNNRAEAITKVLYPPDNIEEGKELRLKQQYFMVSASCQNIIRDHLQIHGTLDNFHLQNVIHINDTHPALCIPELMRIFMDEHGCSWDYAWERVVGSVSYTNHTILAEALEKWKTSQVQALMPRVFSIISEIDRRFRDYMYDKFPGDDGKVDYTAVLGNGQVRMANMAVIGSHKVNGVSALHSQILKDDLFHDYFLAQPDKFTNVTNGIAYRRWLCQANPELAALIDECIGTGYRTDDRRLEDFFRYREDAAVCQRLEQIKRDNKARFADKVKKASGVAIDPDSIFIVQAKRLHEYKRQLLNALRIISRYQMLLDNPDMEMRPETYLFAAKAAPSYFLAKRVIQLICKISQEIEQNPKIASKLKVVFLENYSVSMAESLMPATEISEQISLAGKEASGTGNMKMMINGAVTIGTLDGANVEIREAVGPDSIFIFGKRENEVRKALQEGYNAYEIYENDPVLKRAVDRLGDGFAGKDFHELKAYLLKPSYSIADPYMCLLDFADYLRAHDEIQAAYEDRKRWNTMSVENIAKAARFAADRSIRDYADRIWNTGNI
ncbi:MAG: glycogen/starch/alpha-glucan phosphorylase [Bacillota bacterium]|nr:glycogen/starch/alpha-glucan phosphorylase [Bacillota bacterium]